MEVDGFFYGRVKWGKSRTYQEYFSIQRLPIEIHNDKVLHASYVHLLLLNITIFTAAVDHVRNTFSNSLWSNDQALDDRFPKQVIYRCRDRRAAAVASKGSSAMPKRHTIVLRL